MSGSRMHPEEAFVAGQGPLVDALRALPRFEPPARMAAGFQAMLARHAARPPGFEPPARLESAVLGAIARQQAAQAARRRAVLDEIARGNDPATALDADLSPAARAWLRERAQPMAGDGRLASDPAASRSDRDVARRAGDCPRLRLPAGWWRFAAGGLVAVLALGVGLRTMLEPAPVPESVREPRRVEAPSPAAGSAGSVEGGQAVRPAPGAAPPGEFAEAGRRSRSERRDALVSRDRTDRERAMRERRPSVAAAPPPPPAAASAPQPMPDAPSLAQDDGAPAWRLADDPAMRLRGLAAGSRWILCSHPSELDQAHRWLQRGIDAILADERGQSSGISLRERVRIEPRNDVPAGRLRLVRED